MCVENIIINVDGTIRGRGGYFEGVVLTNLLLPKECIIGLVMYSS